VAGRTAAGVTDCSELRGYDESVTGERILLVEDDAKLAEILVRELSRAYQVEWVATGREALDRARADSPDLIVLDLNLPDIDGVFVAEQLADDEIPILMLTARGDVQSRVEGLYAGASDYVAKPFDMQELLARVYAQLRKSHRPGVVRAGSVEVDFDERACRVDGEPVPLTAQEFRLMALLVEHRGRVFSKTTIEERLYDIEGPASNAVEALVSRVRSKLADAGAEDAIETLRGLGYVVR
jgi:DNA-binding response OmpR family regulator